MLQEENKRPQRPSGTSTDTPSSTTPTQGGLNTTNAAPNAASGASTGQEQPHKYRQKDQRRNSSAKSGYGGQGMQHHNHGHHHGHHHTGSIPGIVPGIVPANPALPNVVPGAIPAGIPPVNGFPAHRNTGSMRPPHQGNRFGHSRGNSFQQPSEPAYTFTNITYGYPPYAPNMPTNNLARHQMPPRPNTAASEEKARQFREAIERRKTHGSAPPATTEASEVPELAKPEAKNDAADIMKQIIAERRERKLREAKANEAKELQEAKEAKEAAEKEIAKENAKAAAKSAAKPETAKPEAAKPEAAKPEAVKPEAAKPEAAKPEAPKAETPKPEAPKADAAKTEPETKPEVVAAEPKSEPKEEKSEPKEEKPEPKVEAKPETKPEPKSEPTPEPNAAPKEAEKPEPKPVGKWIPPSLRRAEEEKARLAAKGESKTEAKPEAKAESTPEATPETSTESTEATEVKPEATEAKAGAEETKPEAKEETSAEQQLEQFNKSLSQARKLTSDELTELSYSEGVIKNELKSSGDRFLYSVDFLGQFSQKVPRLYYENIHPIIGMEYKPQSARWGSGFGPRGMSGRGPSRSGSHAGFGMGGKGTRGSGGGGSMRGRNASRRKGDRQGTRRGDRDDVTSTGIPIADLPPLRTAEDAWTPSFMKKKEEKSAEAKQAEDDLLSPEEVQRKVKSLLNKMAWDNFESVSKKIYAIMLQAVHEKDALTLRQIVVLTFDKAIDEPHWAQIYASFFMFLHTEPTQVPDEVVDESEPDKVVNGIAVLRRYMLNMSQREFEKGWGNATSDQPVEMMSDEYYAQIAMKRRGLGLIQFIGEIYKLGLISVKLLSRCFARLASETPTEDIVESMCKLIRTTATALLAKDKDRMEKGNANPKEPRESHLLDMAMNTVKGWRENPKYNLMPRLKFKIMDIEELSRKKWVGVDEGNGPKTIAQVHLEARAEAERAEKEKARSSRQGSRRGNDFGRNGSGRGRR